MSRGHQCRLLFWSPRRETVPIPPPPAAYAAGPSLSAPREKRVCLRRCGSSQNPKIPHGLVSSRETKLLSGRGQPGPRYAILGLSPGPRAVPSRPPGPPGPTPGAEGPQARDPPRSSCLPLLSPETSLPPETSLLRAAPVSSSLASTLLKLGHSPPSSISPRRLIHQPQPRLAPPAPTSFPPSSDPPSAPFSFLLKPESPLAPPSRPRSPPSFLISPAFPIFAHSLASPPPLRIPASLQLQLCSSPQAWGVDVSRPPRSMVRAGLPSWAQAKGPNSAPSLGGAAAGGLCGSSRCLEWSSGICSVSRRVEWAAGSGPGWANPSPEARWAEGVRTGGGWGQRRARDSDRTVPRPGVPAQPSSLSLHLDEREWAPYCLPGVKPLQPSRLLTPVFAFP